MLAPVLGQPAPEESLFCYPCSHRTWRPRSAGTALHHAVGQRQTAVAQILLEAGADPRAVDRYSRTPAMLISPVEDGGQDAQLNRCAHCD
eukprot:COSAG01_NODE_8392_length_2803_cov_46.105030_4_plen_90_part_00